MAPVLLFPGPLSPSVQSRILLFPLPRFTNHFSLRASCSIIYNLHNVFVFVDICFDSFIDISLIVGREGSRTSLPPCVGRPAGVDLVGLVPVSCSGFTLVRCRTSSGYGMIPAYPSAPYKVGGARIASSGRTTGQARTGVPVSESIFGPKWPSLSESYSPSQIRRQFTIYV